MEELIENSLKEIQKSLDCFISKSENMLAIEKAGNMMADALSDGHKILSCGNGGSLCDASHFAEELTGRYRGSRSPLPAIAINDSAYLTCTANDFSFEDAFSRYVEGVGQPGDVLLAISTSGNSANVLKAVRQAKMKGMMVAALTSEGGNALSNCADVAVCVPKTEHSDHIQEIHIMVIHILIQLIEKRLGVD